MKWDWDAEKNRRNRKKHKLSFETATLVVDDPLAISRPDPHPDEARWQTIGCIGPVVVFVAHTCTDRTARRVKEAAGSSAPEKPRHVEKTYEEGDF